MAIPERLVQVGEEIERVENELRSRRRLLRGHLRPANPAVIGDRMRAAEERIRGLERTNAAGRTASAHCGSDPPR